jgi:hypothetical protein
MGSLAVVKEAEPKLHYLSQENLSLTLRRIYNRNVTCFFRIQTTYHI